MLLRVICECLFVSFKSEREKKSEREDALVCHGIAGYSFFSSNLKKFLHCPLISLLRKSLKPSPFLSLCSKF